MDHHKISKGLTIVVPIAKEKPKIIHSTRSHAQSSQTCNRGLGVWIDMSVSSPAASIVFLAVQAEAVFSDRSVNL
ncbi:MAG: hypothetical protein M3258_06250 [Thermoproteota archaeon]|nr:hypothetical protein [Thermoproteota archaeon]